MNLSDRLRCPACHAAVLWVTGGVECIQCGRVVSVFDGVWCFLDAVIDAGFDERWRRQPRPQATTAGILELKTGFTADDLRGKIVLDAGCGCGRFAKVAQEMGAEVIGVDGAAYALDAARQNAPGTTLLHADLLALPLRDASVDCAFSIGVLHHTADPAAAFREVARTVRPGGHLAVWVYVQPAPDALLPAVRMLHEITRAVPAGVLYDICARHAVALRDMYHDATGEPTIEALRQVLQASNAEDAAECISDLFDWHCPQYRSWHTVEEVRAWFEGSGFDVTRIGDFPVSMTGVRR